MSYRHSSYRKLTKAIRGALEGREFTRAEMDRVMHWAARPLLPKPASWGKPKARRA